MKVGDLIEYTVVGGQEKALGIVLKDLGYNINMDARQFRFTGLIVNCGL